MTSGERIEIVARIVQRYRGRGNTSRSLAREIDEFYSVELDPIARVLRPFRMPPVPERKLLAPVVVGMEGS